MENLPLDSLDISFSFWALVAGFIFGVIGLWIFNRGRKNSNIRQVLIGLAIMIYPVFVGSAIWTWAIGILICGYAYYEWE